jgi:exonuclease SbcC
VALYLSQQSGRRCLTLFCDEADGALDADRKRMFMAMKRKVLELGGYERESPRHPNSRPWRMR